jgi:uncharacterized protein YndB with AHSA1/START domain
MSIILIIVAITTGLIVLFLLAAAVTGKEMNITRTITINRPADEVFNFISHLKNHDHFNVWVMMDPGMKKEYRGTDGTVGFVYTWDSSDNKNVGAGEQEIKEVVPGKSIVSELRFLRPMQSVAAATMTTTTSAGNTTVQWSFNSHMKFPMNAMKPMLQKMLGKQLETGLNNLKSLMEK